MKSVEAHFGCYSPELCGMTPQQYGQIDVALEARGLAKLGNQAGRHLCGSPDACNVVTDTGAVCTHGEMHSAPLFDESDVDARMAALVAMAQHPDLPAIKLSDDALALARALFRSQLGGPGNVESQQAIDDHMKRAEKNRNDNRIFHNTLVAIRGHTSRPPTLEEHERIGHQQQLHGGNGDHSYSGAKDDAGPDGDEERFI